MSQLHDDLVAAKALIARPECWTTHAAARSYEGVYLDVRSPAAVCFCSAGAAMRVLWLRTGDEWLGMGATLDALTAAAGRCAVDFNDAPETTHADILAMFDRAITTSLEEPSP